MKKLISFVLLFALLVSLCACAKEQAAATEPTYIPTYEEILAQIDAEKKAAITPPEELFGHIDQTVPVDGVYKIWSLEGIKNIAKHPEGKFELLCHIDLEGAELEPIPEFTGELNGMYFTVRNFTVKGNANGNFGFIGLNKGYVHNLTIENVTFVPEGQLKNIGALAGVNEGTLLRNFVNESTMTVTSAAEGANCGGMVGLNTGKFQNHTCFVDLIVDTPAAMNVGGIVGCAEGGLIEFANQEGKLVIKGENKTVGVMAGKISNQHLRDCAFLGEQNTLNDKLFENYFGQDENVTYESMWLRENGREPLPPAQQKLRDRVVEQMNAMGLVEWHTTQDLLHSCSCLLTVCHGNYMPGMLHVGIPYNHKGSSLARFNYCRDENGAMSDWVYPLESYDGFDMYLGNDCSTALQQAWWTVSNSTDIIRCTYMHPMYTEQNGCIPIGDLPMDEGIDEKGKKYTGHYTDPYVRVIGEQELFEAYALMRKGDAYYSITKDGGHARMCAADPVVVRNENGLISAEYSYVLSTEQGAPAVTEPYFMSWRVNYPYSFGALRKSYKLPCTMEELLTGEMEPVEASISGDMDGKMGMVTGIIKANYFLDSATMVITDSQGKEYAKYTLFPTVAKYREASDSDSGMRNYNDQFNMNLFTSPLQNLQFEMGETYSYTVTIHLATGDDIQVKAGSFTQGKA